MPPEAWIVLIVLVALFTALIRGLAAPSAILLGGLVVLIVVGVLPLERAGAGAAPPPGGVARLGLPLAGAVLVTCLVVAPVAWS